MIKVGVVGGTGYTGVELLRLLLSHPEVKIEALCSRSEAGQSLASVYPNFSGFCFGNSFGKSFGNSFGDKDVAALKFSEPNIQNLSSCELVFFATPNGVAMNYALELLALGIKVIDLAADFRFKDLALWKSWYDMEHACPELLKTAVYGLPELNRQQIQKANLVGSAGCYTTASQLALLPVLKIEGVNLSNIIIDAKSGVSGAGKSLKASSLYSECGENFSAYGVSGHRHQPEITHSLENYSGKKIGLTFVPHLVPMVRGIFATTYVQFNKSFDLSRVQSEFEHCYQQEHFVDVLPAGSLPATKEVRASNMCRLALHKPNESTLIVLSVIDNLVKGASGQAIQNMNLMLGLEETCGLMSAPLYP